MDGNFRIFIVEKAKKRKKEKKKGNTSMADILFCLGSHILKKELKKKRMSCSVVDLTADNADRYCGRVPIGVDLVNFVTPFCV